MARALSPTMKAALDDLRRAGPDGLRASPCDRALCALERRGLARVEPLADRILTVLWLATESAG